MAGGGARALSGARGNGAGGGGVPPSQPRFCLFPRPRTAASGVAIAELPWQPACLPLGALGAVRLPSVSAPAGRVGAQHLLASRRGSPGREINPVLVGKACAFISGDKNRV